MERGGRWAFGGGLGVDGRLVNSKKLQFLRSACGWQARAVGWGLGVRAIQKFKLFISNGGVLVFSSTGVSAEPPHAAEPFLL